MFTGKKGNLDPTQPPKVRRRGRVIEQQETPVITDEEAAKINARKARQSFPPYQADDVVGRVLAKADSDGVEEMVDDL